MFLVDVTKKDVFKYAFLPQVAPRLKELVASGFQNLAHAMALAYRAAGLLPDNHPYLRISASERYGISDVLIEASKNLVFDFKNIDKVIIFFALIAGLIILGFQFAILFITLMVRPATAANMPSNYGEFFDTKNRTDDIALRLLDSVFGVPGIFGSKNAPSGDPGLFHQALHGLFQIYSVGLLVIAAMIIIYFIFAILAETAQTGTPFGKRYNHAWAPIRLVAAIGLLVPIGTGLNSAQWITLYAAKFGSGFATTGWIKFNETMQESYIPPKELVAEPNIPNMKDVAAFIMIAHACKEAYIIKSPTIGNEIKAYVLDPENTLPAKEAPNKVSDAIKQARGKDIHIRFGRLHDLYAQSKGKVYPFCGDIVVINNQPADKDDGCADGGCEYDNGAGDDTDHKKAAASILQGRYYTLVQRGWSGEIGFDKSKTEAKKMMESRLVKGKEKYNPPIEVKKDLIKTAKEWITDGLRFALDHAIKAFKKDEEYKKLGWGGAGIWYNTIADINGKLVTMLFDKPKIKIYPAMMDFTCEENQQQNNNVATNECYRPDAAKKQRIKYKRQKDEAMATALSDVFDYWFKDTEDLTGNVFIDTVNMLLGTYGLFDMCKNANIHPLAQLSVTGKGLVTAALNNFGYALGFGVGSFMNRYIGPAFSAASSMFGTLAGIGLLIGFLLYYVVPFMPFLYFLFAVGGWIKGIFEAMVGVPLWALAHIRIDGNGLPGEAAINGYFLIFEIFIRPILIVFGLLASILIFGAMVKVLNEIFYLAVSNLAGFDSSAAETTCGKNAPEGATDKPVGSIEYFRGPIDEFFFTVVYAIIVYMIGVSSFKLIDLIPNKILRWMGGNVPTFNDEAGEPAGGLIQKMAVGGHLLGEQVGGGIKGVASAFQRR